MRKKIYRAGTVPYYIEDDGVIKFLFMTPIEEDQRYSGSSFQIAKGKQEENEPLIETAMREAEEELGLRRNNILNFFKAGTFLGRTDIYIAKIMDPEAFNTVTDETDEVMWLTLDEFLDIGRDIHKPVMEEIYNIIVEKENI